MTAALSDMPPGGGWTTDDLDALPEDGRRRELLDGVLLVSPSPSVRPPDHRDAAWRGLEAELPAEY